MPPPPIPLASVRAAWERIADAVLETPLLFSAELSDRLGTEVWLKAEHRQRTGSFKARGALNRLLALTDEARARGVVTVSAGNHASAVAWAASRAGVDATVVMPDTAPATKVRACRRYGATVIQEGDVFDALRRCMEIRDAEARTLVHPFDDPEILEGTGTIALEVLSALARPPTTVIVPIGGGGLIAGIAGTLASASPDTRVLGVEPTGAAAMSRSLEAGHAVRLDRVDTVADGLGAPMAGERTYPVVRDHVAAVVELTDLEILRGLAFLVQRERQVVEPAGAAGVAALLCGKIGIEDPGPHVVIVSGGNLDPDRISEFVAAGSGGED